MFWQGFLLKESAAFFLRIQNVFLLIFCSMMHICSNSFKLLKFHINKYQIVDMLPNYFWVKFWWGWLIMAWWSSQIMFCYLFGAKPLTEPMVLHVHVIIQILLTHWGWVMHICVNKVPIIGSDNGLSPGWRKAIIWTIAVILLIGPSGTNFSKILIEMYTFSYKKCIWKCRLENGSHFISASMC